MAIQLDDFGKNVLERYVDVLNKYNEHVTKARSVPTLDEFTETFLNSDPRFAEFTAKIAKITDVLNQALEERAAAAEPFVKDAYDVEVKAAGIDPEALKNLRQTVLASQKYLTSMYGDEVLADTPKVEGLRTGSGGNNTGSGGRRIRGVEVYVDGVLAFNVNKEGEKKSTFSAAAKVINVETVDLQRAYFAEAGMDDVKADSFPTIVEFNFNDKDGNSHKIRAVKVDDSNEDAPTQ